jgi:hypothetical protein
MSSRRLVSLLATLCALPAVAQYQATTTNGVPYPALSAATPINLVALTGTANDRGRATIPIGFNFPYYDRTFSQITVTANGMAFLDPSTAVNAGADFSTNSLLPNVSEPNGVLAPFWDDLNGRNPGSLIQSQALTGPNGQGLAIEWSDWNWFLTSMYSLTFQLRIWSNGIVEFYYGNVTGNGTAMSATIGIENAPGTIGTAGKLCAAGNAACALTDLQSNQRIAFGPAPGADLSINSLSVNSIATAGANLQVSTTLALRNFGTQPATAFTYRLYLSTDTIYDPGFDVELSPGPQGPISIPALGFLSSTVSTTVPKPTSGSYYIIAVVDDADVVVESNENNNLGATTVPLTAGIDLVAQAISGPPLGGPGEMITTTVTFSNQGIDPAGNVPVKIWLSADSVLSSNDFAIYSTTLPVSGGQNVVSNLTFALPSNVPAGDYSFILQLDDGPNAGAIVETSEVNNVKVGAVQFTARQADLVIDSVKVLEPTAPFGPARYAFFAEPIKLEAVVRNQGGATAPNVSILFYLSDNDTLNGVTDSFIGQVAGLSVAPGQSTTVTLTHVVPATGLGSVPLRPGSYFFFAAAVAQGLVETSNQNNFLKSDSQPVRDPAPDLIAVTLRGPDRAGVGEAFVVTRTLGNVGNRPAGAAKYRYYLSANTIITDSDLLVPMRNPDGTTVDERSVTLGIGEQSPGTDTLVVPVGTPASTTWYLGLLIDPPALTGIGAVAEIDENNNGLAAQLIEVVPQALGLAPQPIPEAMLGLPYQFQLSGQGGNGSYTFTLAAGDALPAGLSLDAATGRISGTPTAVGSFGFSVVVQSGSQSVEERLAMRVVPLSASLSITSTQLPPASRLIAYDFSLGAQGGRAPYSWSVLSGVLPPGITLSPAGQLSGSTGATLGLKFSFTLQVRDSVGNRDQREVSLTVVDGSALLISSAELPGATVGTEYVVDFLAKNAGGAPLATPLKWSVVSGTLPEGLKLEPSTEEKLLISGTPTRAGTFAFTLQVEDARTRSDTADFVLRVSSPGLKLSLLMPEQVKRGDQVLGQLLVEPPQPGNEWSLRDGRLPRGLRLEGDTIKGAIADDAELGAYNFTVAIGGPEGAASLRSFSVEVVLELKKPPRGCGCTETFPAPWALLALMLLLWKRSRLLRP